MTQAAGSGQPKEQGEQSPVRTLSKGLRVLGLFDEQHREWTLDQIAEASGMPRATAHRMAKALEEARYLVLDQHTNKYHLGPAMLKGMYLSTGFSDLVRVARPYLERLAEETDESVTLAVEVDGVAVGVEKIDTARPFRRKLALGTIIGDLANSSGKIFCAYKSDQERQAILSAPHPRLTQFTVTDPEQLARMLDEVRATGLAYDIEERDLGTCAVTGGVWDQAGSLIASISVLVPAGRFTPEARERHSASVRRCCAELSAFLGYSNPDDRSA